MFKTGALLLPLVAFLLSHATEAREYSRLAYTCEIKLKQEDMMKAEVELASFTTKHFITWSEAGELLRPKFEIVPGVGVEPKEWAALEKRIRADLEKSGFAWRKDQWQRNQLEFAGDFKLNYDGIYTLIRALGGKDLEDTDDLTLHDQDDHEMRPDNSGIYRFFLGRGSRSHWWRVQAHLPLDKKDGLSYHLRAKCDSGISGVY